MPRTSTSSIISAWGVAVGLATLLVLTAPLARTEELAAPPTEPPAATAPDEDPLYTQVLQAYRGQLTPELRARVDQADPGPALYLESRSIGLRNVARFFAALPNAAHTKLQREGYLKWRVDALPPAQRDLLKEEVAELQKRGEGPFPLVGKDPATLSQTGFVRVELEGTDVPQYSWWISAPGARRDTWVTLVHAFGLLLKVHSDAHRERLAEILKEPDSPPIPASDWIAVRELPKPEVPPEPVVENEKYFEEVVAAYEGKLRGEALATLTASDALLARRLRSSNSTDRAIQRLLTRLTEKERQTLLTTGVLTLFPHSMTRAQRSLMEPVIRSFNEQARQGGAAGDVYTLIPRAGTRLGFALVEVPGADHPALSWWLRSPAALNPTWITLANEAATRAPGYYRAHLTVLADQ